MRVSQAVPDTVKANALVYVMHVQGGDCTKEELKILNGDKTNANMNNIVAAIDGCIKVTVSKKKNTHVLTITTHNVDGFSSMEVSSGGPAMTV